MWSASSRCRAVAPFHAIQGKGVHMPGPLPGALSAALSATGFGVLLWLGISVALAPSGAHMAALFAPQIWALIIALVLLAASAVTAMASAPPPRDVRALLRATTPWQARRNALAAAAVVLACLTGALLAWMAPGSSRALTLGLVGMLLTATALGAVAAGTMTPASAEGPAGTAHPLALPIHLLASMLTGLALMFALLSGLLTGGQEGGRMLGILLALAVLLLAAAALHRHDATRRARRTAGPGARVADWRSFLLAAALVAGVPALALALGAAGMGGATRWLWLVAVAAMAGIVVERRTQPMPS